MPEVRLGTSAGMPGIALRVLVLSWQVNGRADISRKAMTSSGSRPEIPSVTIPDPFEPEAAHEHLREQAVASGAELARRHGDDLVGPPLGYAPVVAAIARERLDLLTAARAVRLKQADGRLLAARDADARRGVQLEHANRAAADLGVAHPAAPISRARLAAGVAFYGGATVAAGFLGGLVVTRVTDLLAAGLASGVAIASVIAALVSSRSELARTLAHRRAYRALGALGGATSELVEAETRRDCLRTQAAALARAEVDLADELLELHREAATRALPPAALADGGRLVAGEVELELPTWAGEAA